MENAFKRNDWTTRKSFVIKERSLSNLQSHKKNSLSTFRMSQQNVFFQSKSQFTHTLRQPPREEDNNQTQKKVDEVSALKRKFDAAMNFAIAQKIMASSHREQVFKDEKTKSWYESKIQQLEKMIIKERQIHKTVLTQKKTAQSKLGELTIALEQSKLQAEGLNKKISQSEDLKGEIIRLSLLLQDIDPLKERIKTLQGEIRKEKLQTKDNAKTLKLVEKQKTLLQEELKKQKPLQQQLNQHIAYLERVNLDLYRKMEDFDRRENNYIRQVNAAKGTIKKISEEKADLENKLFDTSKKLAEKHTECQALKIQSDGKSVVINRLQLELKIQTQTVANLKKQLQQTIDFYKQQEIQNAQLKVKNKTLTEHQSQYEKVLSNFQQVNDEINLTIISKIEEIKKLHGIIESLEKHSNLLQEKFFKFQVLFEDRTEKGDNEICQFFYLHIRENAKLKIINKELKAQIDEKVLRFGEQRDSWARKDTIRQIDTPSQQDLFGSLYHQKNQEIILLQGSNDQLIKIKKQLQERLTELEKLLQEEKKTSGQLRLKAAEVFRAKRQLEDAKKTMERYQQIVEEQNQTNKDLESQLVLLREKINFLNEKNFLLDLDNKNHLVKIKQLQDIMIEINADVLIEKKTVNDKNAHLINDSIDKLHSGIKSLQFLFSCCFCGQVPSTPTTLSPCGHTYCQKPKCKAAYADFCYECDTGMPVECAFTNKHLKQALTKFNFFQIVIEQATSNVRTFMKNV